MSIKILRNVLADINPNKSKLFIMLGYIPSPKYCLLEKRRNYFIRY